MKLAFDTAEKIGIMPLLEPEDMNIEIPDMKSVSALNSFWLINSKDNGLSINNVQIFQGV